MLKFLEGKALGKQLRPLVLFSPEKRRLKRGLMAAYSFLTREAEGQTLVPLTEKDSSLRW